MFFTGKNCKKKNYLINRQTCSQQLFKLCLSSTTLLKKKSFCIFIQLSEQRINKKKINHLCNKIYRSLGCYDENFANNY